MENILKMTIADKICLLREIKRNYQPIKKVWTDKKVVWLEKQILIELQNLGDFEI